MSNPFFNEQQMKQFREDGFVRLQNIVPEALINKLTNFFDDVTADENDMHKAICEVNGISYVTNIDLLCSKNNLACLELLGAPFLLQIAEAICGKDFFPIQEFAVIKNAGDNLPVYWHLDMLHERKGNCFTVGIYLDDANYGDGALKVIPRSHLSKEDVCTLSKAPLLEVAMQRGDILVHDMMLVHSSDPIRINAKRRVIYFEFLSAKHVATEKIYSETLVENRTNLLNVALAYYRSQNPGAAGFAWEFENTTALQNETQIRQKLDEIYSMPINARPSTYCFDFTNHN